MSNQVYRDKQAAIPYDGEQNALLLTLTGAPGGATGQLGIRLSQINPTTVAMYIVGSTSGIVWNSATSLTSAVGIIPAAYRPLVFNASWIVLVIPSGLNVIGLLNVDSAGTITIHRPPADTGTPASVFPTGAQISNQTIIWNIA